MPAKHMSKTRSRQYAADYKGEIIVFIHKSGDGLKRTKDIYKTLFNNYKHVNLVTVVNKNKLKILFEEKENRQNAIQEANNLAKCDINDCTIYIPANYVEVQGVVSWPIGENLNDFVNGKGKFKNSMMKDVKVLDSVRLLKKSNVASNVPELEETSIVIITFEGNLLPDKLVMDKLIVPVREYRRREMFCENCKKYGHTKKMCNNKKLEHPTYLCMQCKTNNHLGGSNQCPRRKVLEKKNIMTFRKLRQRTFAEMLKELDPHGVANETQQEDKVPTMSFPSRKDEVSKKIIKNSEKLPKSQSSTKAQKSSLTSNKYPPGFKKPEQSTSKINAPEQSSAEVFTDLMSDLQLPPMVQQLFINHVVPYIDQLLDKLLESFSKKILELFSLNFK